MLNADYTQRLLTVFRIMKERHGYEMAILEGYRSPARQDALAALGAGVTNARSWQSWHQYGLAADCGFVRDGRLVISEKDPWAMRGYQLYGQVAESVGLTWGGRWKMMDFGHTELRLPGVMKH
jgi:peptidoglycan L-alanyl-D-glutamate endopeptidase CwlK